MAPPSPSPSQPAAIEAYGGGGFRVGERRHEGSILILDGVVSPWPARAVGELTPEHFAAVTGSGTDRVGLVLLGSGPQTAIAPRPVRDALQAAGVGLEMMNTPEACRMYNFLVQDGRRLAAALIAV